MAVSTKTERNLKQMESVVPTDDPNVIQNEDGTVTVDLSSDEEEVGGLGAFDSDELEESHYANLVDEISEDELTRLGAMVISNVEADEASRADWMRTIELGFDLIGVKIEEKNEPFQGACSAQHPLLMESSVKFQSKASSELLPADGPVKVKVLGDSTLEKEAQANRIKSYMNYQITEEMTEFYTDSERMLLYVPLIGSGFKKTYYCGHAERPVSEFVPADQFLVPNSASDLHRADRYTHILTKTEYDLEADFAADFYKKPDEGLCTSEPNQTTVQDKLNRIMGTSVSISDEDKVYTLYEQHINVCIDGLDERKKGYKLASPYIITVEEGSGKVIGVRRNWKEEDDKKRKKKVQFTHYQFVPSFGFYGFGYLHLLGNLQLTLTASLRSLVDAGQFANLQGGFKLKGVRIIDDGSPIYPGQFKDIECASMDIDKAIKPLPFKGADQTLFAMLQYLTDAGQKFADSTEQVLADSSNYGPVGTTMALLDASTKFFSAVHKRLHNSLKQELRIIAEINAETLPDDLEYNVSNDTMKVSREDFDGKVDVVPVSDPNISSNAHRMAKAQAILQTAMLAPQIHDMQEVYKHFYTSMDYTNIDKILPPPEEAQPNDPLTDLQAASQGKPIKAFPGQDHKAHIMLKQAFLQDPMSGANPMMQKVSVQIQANIQEHMLLNFQEQVTAQAQQAGQEMAPEQAMGQAASQVAQMNQQQLQREQEQAQQGPQDQATLLIAQAEMLDTQTQAKKADADVQLEAAKLKLKEAEIQLAYVKEQNRKQEMQAKLEYDDQKMVKAKGIDAMIKGFSDHTAIKMKKMDHQNQQDLADKQAQFLKAKDKDKPKKDPK